jgi:Plasmid pRiA4b ORF-3-like protein
MSPARSSVTPSTHTFRVRILGGFYAPPDALQIWRELELTGDQTLGDLGEAIPLAFGFDDPHLWSFFLSGKPWDEATEYALMPSPDPAGGGGRARAADRLHIRDVPAGKEFLFLFDYGDEWHFGVRLVRSGKAPNPGVRYPQVVASHGQAPPQYPAIEDDGDEQAEDEEFLAQWEQAEAEAVEVLRGALPPQARPSLPAGDLAAACRRLRAGLGRHDPAVETIRRAAGLDPPLPADDAELWLAAAGALIAMLEPSGLDPELEAAVMALELADWVGAVVGLVRGGVGANAEPAALVAAINDCPEVDGTVDPDDADLVELAFEVVLPTWEAVGAVDADRRLTALGAWGLPRALVRAWGSDLDAT